MMNAAECDFICQIDILLLVLIFYSERFQVDQQARIKFYYAV